MWGRQSRVEERNDQCSRAVVSGKRFSFHNADYSALESLSILKTNNGILYVTMFNALRCRRYIQPTPVLSRSLKSSKSRSRTMVGPPDPVSNLRPTIYEDQVSEAESSKRNAKGKEVHPYLLDEFDGDPTDYQWRLERQRLDAFNHAFWTDVCRAISSHAKKKELTLN